MKIDEKMLIEEIKTLKKAAQIHTKYSIAQYKKVLKLLEELEKEKKFLEQKVKERTLYLEQQIKENEKLTQRLKELATYDPLTKLLNRRIFSQKLHEFKNKYFSVMFLDLDGFKEVNDVYGHKIGDELLKIVARRIITSLRNEDLVGRLGGDEFVILIDGKKDKKSLENIAKKLIKKISSPIVINDIKIKVGTSIGIYSYNKNDPIDRVLSFADSAMYEAKKSGKGKYVFYSDFLNKEYIQQEVKKAFENNWFKIEYIPIFFNKKVYANELSIKLHSITFKEIIFAIEDIELLEKIIIYLIKNTKQDEKNLIYLPYKLFNKSFLEKLKTLNVNFSNICFSINAKNFKYIKRNILEQFLKEGFSIVLDNFEKVNLALVYLEHPINAVKIEKFNSKTEKEKRIFEAFLDIARMLNIKVIVKCTKSLCIKN